MNQHRIIKTERTYFRRISQDDVGDISAILGDVEVMYAWEHAFSHQEVVDWIEENIMRYARDGYSYWAVCLQNTDRIIGVSGLLTEHVDGEAYIGIGYIFHKAFWRQGFAVECAKACKYYAFHTLDIPLLTAQIRPGNTSSIRVATKLGMSEIKRFDRVYRGVSVPHILYGCSS